MHNSIGLALAFFMAAWSSFASATATEFALGTLNRNASIIQERTFSTGFAGTFTDYYTFSIGIGYGNLLTRLTEHDGYTSTQIKDIATSGFSLYKDATVFHDDPDGGVFLLGGTQIPVDWLSGEGPASTELSAGNYTLKITGSVLPPEAVSVAGHASRLAGYTVSMASAAPEPADLALTIVGLVGVGYMVKSRKAKRTLLS